MERYKRVLMLLFAVILICITGAGSHAAVQSWTIESHYDQTITFTFDGSHLYLNQNSISQSGPDWLVFWGADWSAQCASIVNSVAVPDPYATFVRLNDVGHCGYINWAANTPAGYTAPLLMNAYVTSGGYSGGHGFGPVYNSYSTVFTAAVPEPSSLLALVCSLGGLGAAWCRRK